MNGEPSGNKGGTFPCRVITDFDLDTGNMELKEVQSIIPGFRFYEGYLARNHMESIYSQDDILHDFKNYLSGNIINMRPRMPLIMGIVNMTPDSFYGNSRYLGNVQGIRRIVAGSDVVDVGGESSRPGAMPIDPETEFHRIKPALELLSSYNKEISVDTRNPETLERAAEYGVTYANDISGFSSKKMVDIALLHSMKCVLMHMRGDPSTMMHMTRYVDVVSEVSHFLIMRARELLRTGIRPENVIIDPGIGFSKTAQQSLTILRKIENFNGGFNVLVGHSRKSFLGHLIGDMEADRLPMTLSVSNYLAQKGVYALRVHDPVENRNSISSFLSLHSSSQFPQ